MPKERPGSDPPTTNSTSERRKRLKALRARLEVERASLARWMTRLKRSFHSFEKIQARVSRLEKDIAKFENT